jgi:hypothetical protein
MAMVKNANAPAVPAPHDPVTYDDSCDVPDPKPLVTDVARSSDGDCS